MSYGPKWRWFSSDYMNTKVSKKQRKENLYIYHFPLLIGFLILLISAIINKESFIIIIVISVLLILNLTSFFICLKWIKNN